MAEIDPDDLMWCSTCKDHSKEKVYNLAWPWLGWTKKRQNRPLMVGTHPYDNAGLATVPRRLTVHDAGTTRLHWAWVKQESTITEALCDGRRERRCG